MTSPAISVLAVGLVGLTASSLSRRWALRVTRRAALLHRLEAGAVNVELCPQRSEGGVRSRRPWLLLGPLGLVLPGAWSGFGAVSLVVALASTAAVLLGRWAGRLREPARYEQTLVAALDGLGRQLRSGASLRSGLVQVADDVAGPLGQDLRRLHSSIDRGELFSAALHRWAEVRPLPAVAQAVAGLGVGHESGALRARHVEALADGLRQAQQVQREARSWAAQAQTSALIMVVSPLAFSLLMATGDPAMRSFFAHTPMGLLCLSLGLTLDLGAAAVMTHMVAAVR